MILYFDSFITDVPLDKNFVDPNSSLRAATPSYAMPSKVDIAKYSLASYATYPWSHVLIRYELENESRYEEFETFVRDLFPTATIIKKRSATQAEYQRSLEILNSFPDKWIWYAPNNDHPITTHDLSIIDRLLNKADSYSSEYKYISIPYSHYSEFLNLPRTGSPYWHQYGQETEFLNEDSEAIVCLRHDGDHTAVQIVNKNLMNHWFSTYELSGERIIRSESIRPFFLSKPQLMVIPKREIGAHFDGYSHSMRSLTEIAPEQIPPLFIPKGFFEKNIKIKYGFTDYDPEYTNVNPCAKYYPFENRRQSSDIKCTLKRLPLFWKDRISEVVVNPAVRAERAHKCQDRLDQLFDNPYRLKHKKFRKGTAEFIYRTYKYRYLPAWRAEVRRKVTSVLRKGERLLRRHPTSAPYLSGDTFRSLATHIHDMDSEIKPQSIKAKDLVFVQSPRIEDFFTRIHPRITEPYILITHNGDENITEKYTPFITETISHWFAQNCLITHPKVTPIPIGLENKWYHLHGIPHYFNILRKRTYMKEFRILYKFNVRTNPVARSKALSILDNHPLTYTYMGWRESYEYLMTLQQYSFVASPPGNGEDCIRTWEAMYLGTIPIVKRSPMSEYFTSLGLPIVTIDDWNELDTMNPKGLRDLYEKQREGFAAPALWADFWIDKIKQKVHD